MSAPVPSSLTIVWSLPSPERRSSTGPPWRNTRRARTTGLTITTRTITITTGIPPAIGAAPRAPGAATALRPDGAAEAAATAADSHPRRSDGRQADDGPAQPEDRMDGQALRGGGKPGDVPVGPRPARPAPLRRRDLRLRRNHWYRLCLREMPGRRGPLRPDCPRKNLNAGPLASV